MADQRETVINVLDGGSVALVESTPNADLLCVNAARVSFAKKAKTLQPKDVALINYLVKHRHDSPFRHAHVTFRIKAPEFVMRQWYKHVVGISYSEGGSGMREVDHAWNEVSGRYIEYGDEFYHPASFRRQSSDNKQATVDEPVAAETEARELYAESVRAAHDSYKKMLSLGVGREIARTVLPLSLYTEVIWTASLQAALNFVALRSHPNSQQEIQEYAGAVRDLLRAVAPAAVAAWEAHRA